jgi:hypothetical protein
MATIHNALYFSGYSTSNRDSLSPEEKLLDTISQTKISRLLNCSQDKFVIKMKNDPSLVNLKCDSDSIMSKWFTKKLSIGILDLDHQE